MISKQRMLRVSHKLGTPLLDGYTAEFYGEEVDGKVHWIFDPMCTCDSEFDESSCRDHPELIAQLMSIPPTEPEKAFEIVEKILGIK